MFPKYRDVPLEADESARFLPWIIAFMVYLAALALAGAMALHSVVSRWDSEVAGSLTVQIPIAAETLAAEAGTGAASRKAAAQETAREAARLKTALGLLRTTPGIVAAEPLDRSEVETLLEPWLGAGVAMEDLPLPRVIDVLVDTNAPPDMTKMAARLSAAVPGASVDDHALWFGHLATLATAAEMVAVLVVLLTGLAAVLTVVFVTRSGLSVHRKVIDVLHVIGAPDTYIARHFQFHALVLGLRGSVVGLLLAVFTILMIGLIADRVALPLLPEVSLTGVQWAVLAAMPVAATAIAMATARATVLRTLGRML